MTTREDRIWLARRAPVVTKHANRFLLTPARRRVSTIGVMACVAFTPLLVPILQRPERGPSGEGRGQRVVARWSRI